MDVRVRCGGGLLVLDPHDPPALDELGRPMDRVLDGNLDAATLTALDALELGSRWQLLVGGEGVIEIAIRGRPAPVPPGARVAGELALPWRGQHLAVLDAMHVSRYAPGRSLVGPPPPRLSALPVVDVLPGARSLVIQRLVWADAPVVHGLYGAPGHPALVLMASADPADHVEGVPRLDEGPLALDPDPAWEPGDLALGVVRKRVGDGARVALAPWWGREVGLLADAGDLRERDPVLVRLGEVGEDGVTWGLERVDEASR